MLEIARDTESHKLLTGARMVSYPVKWSTSQDLCQHARTPKIMSQGVQRAPMENMYGHTMIGIIINRQCFSQVSFSIMDSGYIWLTMTFTRKLWRLIIVFICKWVWKLGENWGKDQEMAKNSVLIKVWEP